MSDQRKTARGWDERRDEYSLSMREQAALTAAPKRKRRLDVADLAGKVWNAPNTALGLAYGLAGHAVGHANRLRPGDQPDPRIQVGNNAVEFVSNPFGGVGAITLGNTITYRGDPLDPNDVSFTDNGKWPWSVERGRELVGHERQHTVQGQQLGPFYLPSNLLGGLNGLIRDKDWHGPHNWNERGPKGAPQKPWAPKGTQR